MDEPTADVSGVAALADPLRRRLYGYVARRREPVGREEVAEATGTAVHTVKFHLDRMVDDGLLEVEYRRLTGRTGPGAGRPAKLYRRADREFSVSLPQRHYDLLSEVLADAAAASVSARRPVDEVVGDVARRHGARLGAEWSGRTSQEEPLERLAETLEVVGYEPQVEDRRVLLENCPFDRVAREHTALVCGLNLDYVGGVIDGLGCAGVEASLEPAAGRCCVTARRADQTDQAESAR